MLLTIDIGNSSIHCGVFDADRLQGLTSPPQHAKLSTRSRFAWLHWSQFARKRPPHEYVSAEGGPASGGRRARWVDSHGQVSGNLLRHEWRMETVRDATAQALALQLIGDRHQSRIGACPQSSIDGVVIASVVPSLDAAMAAAAKDVTRCTALFVGYPNAGVPIKYPQPEEIGADRLANAAGAIAKYGTPCLVVDFGTATTFDYIDADGAYCGGPIAPGIGIGNAALAHAAAKLQPTPLAATDRMIPQSTAEAIQAGVFHGHVGLSGHLIGQLQREVGTHPKVIATGGLAALIAPHCPAITTVDPHLTLEGLRVIWTRNV